MEDDEQRHKMSGLWLFVLGNTQFIVTLATAMTLLRLRSAHALFFGVGTLVASFSAKGAKRLIRQPRPVGAKKYDKTYGMPSTHSCSIAFFGTYLTLASLFLSFHPRLVSLLPSAHQHWIERQAVAAFVRLALAAFWITAAASVCWSRVKLGHHTPEQVIVGASLGAAIAVVWLTVWQGTANMPLLGRLSVTTTLSTKAANGLRVNADLWEQAAQDAIFALLEAYEKRSAAPLRTLLSFPLSPREL